MRRELVTRLWNGRWGRLVRRDIWLRRAIEETWIVEARRGDSDSPLSSWSFDNEPDARAMLRRLMDSGGDGWRDITILTKKTDEELAKPPAVQQ
jgi:hypothetical protein